MQWQQRRSSWMWRNCRALIWKIPKMELRTMIGWSLSTFVRLQCCPWRILIWTPRVCGDELGPSLARMMLDLTTRIGVLRVPLATAMRLGGSCAVLFILQQRYKCFTKWSLVLLHLQSRWVLASHQLLERKKEDPRRRRREAGRKRRVRQRRQIRLGDHRRKWAIRRDLRLRHRMSILIMILMMTTHRLQRSARLNRLTFQSQWSSVASIIKLRQWREKACSRTCRHLQRFEEVKCLMFSFPILPRLPYLRRQLCQVDLPTWTNQFRQPR